MVERGIQMQQQLLKEKRVKKSEKLVRAASKALEIARADSGYSTAKALADAAFLEVAALRTKWTVVQEFGTKEDALRFVLECQPFDYRPAGDAYDDFPRFQNSKDCLAYVMALEPFPSEFQSCEPVFKRRLRLQLAKEGEQKPDSAQRKTKPRPRTVMGQPSSDGARWQVQAAGCLFETPGLRMLAEKPPAQRYYIAVPPEMEKKVLAEGYQPQKRSSIPCSSSPQEALAAFMKVTKRMKEEREQVDKRKKESQVLQQGEDSLDDRVWRHLEWTAASELYPVLSEDLRGVRATVLAAVVPPELGFDIVACQSGGFIIRTKGRALPGSCFSRLKRPGGDSYQT